MYMPFTGKTVAATTMIKFHDVKKGSDGNAHAYATFAFATPGYDAPMPVSFGFAAIPKAEKPWVIGQEQVLVKSDSADGTHWSATFEAVFGYPTMTFGIMPFIAVGGHPLYQRYPYAKMSNVSCEYFKSWSPSNLEKDFVTKFAVTDKYSTGVATDEAYDFAADCFNQSQTGESGLVLCPYDFTFWQDKANYINGWGTRGQADLAGHTVGSGIMFCGRSKCSFTTDSPPTYYDTPYVINKGVYVYDAAGKQRHADKIFVYDSSGKKKQVAHLYVYDESKNRRQVF